MNQARTAAVSALTLMAASVIIGWLLYMAGRYTDIVTVAGIPSDELYGDSAVPLIYPSKFFFFAAIAFVAIASLIAHRRTAPEHQVTGPLSRLTGPVRACAATIMIVALAIATAVAIAGFLESFSDTRNRGSALYRVIDAYLPIVLYTALIVGVLLYGFVFQRKHPSGDVPTTTTTASSASSTNAASTPSADVASHDETAFVQRSIGFAFAVPIIAVAIALILGLIVYDVTQTSLDAWIWVIIITIVALGIVWGTVNSSRAKRALATAHRPLTGVTVSAVRLNFVLSIVFGITVCIMSLSYGASATNQLRVQHDISLNVSFDQPVAFDNAPQNVDLSAASVFASGSGLRSGSHGVLTIEPDGTSFGDEKVDSSGYFYADASIPDNIDVGDKTITLQATVSDGTETTVELPLTVAADGTASFPNGTNAYVSSGTVKLGQIDGEWLMRFFLPPFVLIWLATLTVFVTLTARNRDES